MPTAPEPLPSRREWRMDWPDGTEGFCEWVDGRPMLTCRCTQCGAAVHYQPMISSIGFFHAPYCRHYVPGMGVTYALREVYNA